MTRASTLFDLSDLTFYIIMIIRTVKKKNYTVVSNDILNSPKISLKAKGLIIFMLSKPDVWDFSVNGLKSQLKEGRDSLSNTLKELEKNRYLKRVQSREKGKFSSYEYELHEIPFTENPNTVNPITENQEQVSTNKSKELNKVSTELNYIPQNQKNDFEVGLELTEEDTNYLLDVVKKEKSSAKKEKWTDEFVEMYKQNPVLYNLNGIFIDECTEITKEQIDSLSPRKKPKIYSMEVLECYSNCLNYFESHLHPKTDNQKNSWLDTIDKLNRIDKIPFSEIERITQEARNDPFWSKNFLSLTKLRMKDKQKVPYIVVFSEKFKKKEVTLNRQTEGVIKSNLKGW